MQEAGKTLDWITSIGSIGSAPQHHLGGANATRRLLEMAQLAADQKILVLGCGNGETAIQLARKLPYSIVATDINPLSVSVATKRWERIKKKAMGQIEFYIDDLFHSQFPAHTFDRIIIESVLIMLPKLPALRILHDLLTQNGKLAVNEGVCMDAFFPALKIVEKTFQEYQIDWGLPTAIEWASLFDQARLMVTGTLGPSTYSLKRIGLASFFHNPWQSLKIAWKIMRNSQSKLFFRQVSTQMKVAAIKWGYGLWICQPVK